jgi:hypothetical protein
MSDGGSEGGVGTAADGGIVFDKGGSMDVIGKVVERLGDKREKGSSEMKILSEDVKVL